MTGPMITASGVTKSYGAVKRARRRRPRGAARHRARAARAERRRQDDDGADPVDAACRWTPARATVAGHDVATDRRDVRRSISLTGQYAAVDDLLTGEENLLLMAKLRRLPRAEARSATAELLAEFDLTDAADGSPRPTPAGMRRRLDLAISLITRPPVIFLDEPTTGLDLRSRQTMWDVVRKLVADGTTILLTTQYLEEADQLADSIAVLDARQDRLRRDGGRAQAPGRGRTGRADVRRPGDSYARGVACSASPPTASPTTRSRGWSACRRTGLPPASSTSSTDSRTTSVPVDRLALHRPSLDDVFLSLTGR